MSSQVRIFTWMLPPMFDLGLRAVFEPLPNYTYVGAYGELEPLTRALSGDERLVDILFMDYQNAFPSYPQLISALRQINHRLRVLFILPTVFEDSMLIHALRSGGDGYLLQCVTQDVLLNAVEQLVNGQGYIDTKMTPAVLRELRKPIHAMRDLDVQIELTERERLLVQLAADGLSNVQIGQVLGLAEKTVRNLWSTLFDKVGFSDRTQTVLWAIRTGQAELR